MNKLYAVSLVAHGDIKESVEDWSVKASVSWSHIATYFYACSDDEASGKALRLCKEWFPESSGYTSHNYHVVAIKFKKENK
jgi:hypothetical protein